MIGLKLGGYRIIDKLDEGGMAEIWLAMHETLNQEAAVKVLLPSMSARPEMVKRFVNEARAAAAIKHPGIVDVHDVGNTPDGRTYIVMEMLRGESLQSRLKRQPQLPFDTAVRFMRQLASVMVAAHARKIVHRDLKPDNIFVVPDPDVVGGERIKVLDFGLAKLAHGTSSLMTKQGTVFGTPVYMSPEQCLDSGNVDPRSDLYSIGCIFYRCLCGRPPFTGFDLDVLGAHLHQVPPRPSQFRTDLPRELESLILELLEKKVEERVQSCADLLLSLETAGVPEPIAGDEDTTQPYLDDATVPFVPEDEDQDDEKLPTLISVDRDGNGDREPGQSARAGVKPDATLVDLSQTELDGEAEVDSLVSTEIVVADSLVPTGVNLAAQQQTLPELIPELRAGPVARASTSSPVKKTDSMPALNGVLLQPVLPQRPPARNWLVWSLVGLAGIVALAVIAAISSDEPGEVGAETPSRLGVLHDEPDDGLPRLPASPDGGVASQPRLADTTPALEMPPARIANDVEPQLDAGTAESGKSGAGEAQAGAGEIQAGEPAPRATGESKPRQLTAKQQLDLVRKTFADKRFVQTCEVCQEAQSALKGEPTTALLCVIAACKLKRQSMAKRWHARLPPADQISALQPCLNAGIELELARKSTGGKSTGGKSAAEKSVTGKAPASKPATTKSPARKPAS